MKNTENEDPKAELIEMRALLAARQAEVNEQARRFRALARENDDRGRLLANRLDEIDDAIAAIDARRGP